MFSINRRRFMAYQTGLPKARGHRKGQNRFWPVAAGQKRQKLAGYSSLPFPFPLPLLCTALQCTQCYSPVHPTRLCKNKQVCARPPSLPLCHFGVT